MAFWHEIKWGTACQRMVNGRNGMSNGCGLQLSLSGNEVLIEPINSKGNTTQCQIPVPVSSIDKLICALQDLRRESGAVHPLICTVMEIREAQDGGEG